MDLSPPANIDLYASKQTQLYVTYSVTFILAVIAVGLRILCRLSIKGASLWWDDYLSCLALVFATGNFVDMIIWVKRGVGTHIYRWGLPGVSNFYKNLFVCEILYTLALCVNKYSVLLFFWRIFKSTNIRVPIFVITGVVTAWGLGVILTTVFQCVPLEGLWNYSVSSYCGVNINNFFIGNAVPNIITDWALLILPLPYIWKVHRSTIQKVALCATFAIGGFICIISIVRLVIMLESYKQPSVDVTWVFIGPSTWTAVETNIGIVSACLPSLRPLLKLFPRNSSRKVPGDSDGTKLIPFSGYSLASANGGNNTDCDYRLKNGIDVTTDMRVEISPKRRDTSC